MERGLVQINDANFDELVLGSIEPVLVEFEASWCAPCQLVKRVLRSLAASYGSKVKFCFVDIASSPVTAIKCGVHSVPKVMLFQNGRHAATVEGVATPEKLRSLLDGCLE